MWQEEQVSGRSQQIQCPHGNVLPWPKAFKVALENLLLSTEPIVHINCWILCKDISILCQTDCLDLPSFVVQVFQRPVYKLVWKRDHPSNITIDVYSNEAEDLEITKKWWLSCAQKPEILHLNNIGHQPLQKTNKECCRLYRNSIILTVYVNWDVHLSLAVETKLLLWLSQK